VNLGACGWVIEAEASACASEVYLDVLTVTGLEGQEGLNSRGSIPRF